MYYFHIINMTIAHLETIVEDWRDMNTPFSPSHLVIVSLYFVTSPSPFKVDEIMACPRSCSLSFTETEENRTTHQARFSDQPRL